MTKLPGPRDRRPAPGNLLQGGVKDEARPWPAPRSVAGGPRGPPPSPPDPGPAQPDPARRIRVRHVRAPPLAPRAHLKWLKRSLSPSKRWRKLSLEPCSWYHACSFLNCGFWVSAAMARAAENTDWDKHGGGSWAGGARQTKDRRAQRALWRRPPAPLRPVPAPAPALLSAVRARGATWSAAEARGPQLVSPCHRRPLGLLLCRPLPGSD